MRALSVIAVASFFVACSNPGAPGTIAINRDPGIPPCDGSESPDVACWDDDDGKVETASDPRTSDAQLNTILIHERASGQASAHLTVASYRDDIATDAEKSLLVQEEAHVRGVLEPPNIAIGTCGPIMRPPSVGDALTRIDRGLLSLLADDDPVVCSVNPRAIAIDKGQRYSAYYDHVSFAIWPSWNLVFDGGKDGRPFKLWNATGPIPTLSVTAPSVGASGVTIPAGPLTVAWAGTRARRMVISVNDAVCAVDPRAGSFTIPREIIGGPGEKIVRIDAGDIRRLGIPSLERSILSVQLDTQSFALHVQ